MDENDENEKNPAPAPEGAPDEPAKDEPAKDEPAPPVEPPPVPNIMDVVKGELEEKYKKDIADLQEQIKERDDLIKGLLTGKEGERPLSPSERINKKREYKKLW